MIVTPAYPRIIPQVQRGQVRDLDRGLVGHWPFDLDARDVSGNGNDGTVYGAIKTKGIIRGAYRFNGVNNYISLPDLGLHTTSEMSMVMCAKSDSFASERMFSMNNGNDAQVFIRYNSGYAQVFARGTDAESTSKNSFAIKSDGMYHLIAGVINEIPGRVHLYVDGIDEGYTDHGSAFTDVALSERNGIGRASDTVSGGPSQYFKGFISDARIYNRALSPTEIRQLYLLGGHRFIPTALFLPTQVQCQASYDILLQQVSKALYDVYLQVPCQASYDVLLQQVCEALYDIAGFVQVQCQANYDILLQKVTQALYDIYLRAQCQASYDVFIRKVTQALYDILLQKVTQALYDIYLRAPCQASYDVFIRKVTQALYDILLQVLLKNPYSVLTLPEVISRISTFLTEVSKYSFLTETLTKDSRLCTSIDKSSALQPEFNAESSLTQSLEFVSLLTWEPHHGD